MKLLIITIIVFTGLFIASMASAQKLYTWTDENGNLHITQDPPPESAKVEEVVHYKERSPEEEAARQRRNEKFRHNLEQEREREKSREARLEAEEAEKKAQKMKEDAQRAYEENKAYIDRLSNRKWKRKQFRKRIDRLKRESEQGLIEAEEAVKRAQEAKAEAGIEVEQESQ